MPFLSDDTQHFAVDRRGNTGKSQVGPGRFLRHFGLNNLRLVHFQLRQLRVVLRLRFFQIAGHAGTISRQRLLPRQLQLVLPKLRLTRQFLRLRAA